MQPHFDPRLSYHGTDKSIFYCYPLGSKPPNYGKWDFTDNPDYVCMNYKVTEKPNMYLCKGHERGDKHWPAYHGNYLTHIFYQLPENMEIQNPREEVHQVYCDYPRFMKDLDNGVKQFQCQGHQLSYHGEANHRIYIYSRESNKPPANLGKFDFYDSADHVCSALQPDGTCPGHAGGDSVHPTFHGHPNHDNQFSIIPGNQKLTKPQFKEVSEFRYMPCDNAQLIKKKDDGNAKYQCLGHHLSFHGDPFRGHQFWIYPKGTVPPNLGKWDFTGSADYVCSNKVRTSHKTFRCRGHPHGDIFYPTFHGDPANQNKFKVVPHQKKLSNVFDEFRVNVCTNSTFVKELTDGILEYQCLGHSMKH